MSKAEYEYVILGGGLAAGYAAQAFVEVGIPAGALCILSAEDTLPYERPPLSKGFLAGKKEEEDILINAPVFYEQHGIEVRLNSPVKKVDLDARKLFTDEDSIQYEQLMIATGSYLRRLDVPGVDLDQIFYLRRLEHSRQIRQAAQKAKRAVVIGGSFIGLESVSVLAQGGLETTLVFPEERVWESFFTPEMSAFFEQYYRERGVEVVKETKAVSFQGERGLVTQVTLENGRKLPTDMVVVGVGVKPNTQLFEDTALEIHDGIVVDEYLRTEVPGVYAVGDVARYYDVLFDKHRRIEHWDNAVAQAKYAAGAMTGRKEPFENVPYFFSDEFDLSYEFWGDTENTDKIIHRGNMDEGQFSVWWLNQERVFAAFVMDRPEEERELAAQWVSTHALVNLDLLANDSLALKPLIDENSTPG